MNSEELSSSLRSFRAQRSVWSSTQSRRYSITGNRQRCPVGDDTGARSARYLYGLKCAFIFTNSAQMSILGLFYFGFLIARVFAWSQT